jgi:nickel-dependent lactate racemase
MVPAVLAELDGIVRLEDIVILIATETHRGNSERELRQMLGDEIVDRVRIINHDARDHEQLTWVGTFGDEALDTALAVFGARPREVTA